MATTQPKPIKPSGFEVLLLRERARVGIHGDGEYLSNCNDMLTFVRPSWLYNYNYTFDSEL